jgi:hypothetical protein
MLKSRRNIRLKLQNTKKQGKIILKKPWEFRVLYAIKIPFRQNQSDLKEII